MLKKIIIVILCVIVHVHVAYAEYQVAVIDLNRVVNSMSEAKIKQQELEKLSKQAEQEYKKRVEKVKSLEKQYASTNKKELGLALEKEVRGLKLFVNDSKENIKRKFSETNNVLIKKVMEIVKDYAEDNDIDLVLDKNSLVLGVVVFSENAIDITDALTKLVNK